MSFTSSMTGLLRQCARGGCQSLNLLLAALACLQVGLTVLNQLQRVVPLPEEVLRAAVQQVAPEDFQLSWSAAQVDLRGGLLFKDLKVQQRGSDDAVFEAAAFHLDFSLPRFLLPGSPALRSLTFFDGRLFPPPALSPSGVAEEPLRLHHARLGFSGGGKLRVENLYAEVDELVLSLDGEGKLPKSRGESPETFSESLPRIVGTFWQSIYQLPLEDTALLRVKWDSPVEGGQSFAIRSFLRSLPVPGGRLREMDLQGRVRIKEEEITLTDLRARGEADLTLSLPGWANFLPLPRTARFQVSSEGPATSLSENVSGPERIHSQWVGTETGEEKERSLAVGMEWNLADKAPFLRLRGSGHGLFLATSWRPDLEDLARALYGSGPLTDFLLPQKLALRFEVSGDRPRYLLGLPFLPEFLHQGTADGLSFSGSFFPSAPRLQGGCRIDGLRSPSFARTDFTARLDLSTDNLRLPSVRMSRPSGETASGSYQHNLRDSRFVLKAKGRLLPASLDPILGKWWQDIFTSIRPTRPADARVMVWGNARKSRSIRSSVDVKAEEARYNNVPVPDLQLEIRSNENWTFLHYLEATFSDGKITGALAWRIHNPSDRLRPMRIRLRSNVAFPRAIRLSGISALSVCRFTQPPLLEMEGWLWHPSKNGQRKEKPGPKLRLRVDAPRGSFQIADLSFSHTTFKARVEGSRILFENLSARFSEGVLTGDLAFTRKADSGTLRPRRLDLQLLDADLGDTLDQLDNLFPDWNLAADSLLKEGSGGRLDTGFRLELPDSDVGSGQGWLHIREARLGSVHLFGGFSALLQDLGLGFSSLDLGTASVDWRWQDPFLHFDHFVISGPVLHLRIDGDADLASRTLALSGSALLFEGLVQRLLAPVSNRIAFEVTGPLRDPRWSLQLEPLQWLRSRIFQP